jgi:hypothetical protein
MIPPGSKSGSLSKSKTVVRFDTDDSDFDLNDDEANDPSRQKPDDSGSRFDPEKPDFFLA